MVTRFIPEGFGNEPRQSVYESPDSPKAWLDEVETYLEFRDQYKSEWLENERHYDADPHVTPALARANRLGRAYGLIQTLAAGLLNARPKMFVQDLTGEDPDAAKLYEHLVNADWAFHDDAYSEATRAVLDMAIYGFGVTMTTYEMGDPTALERRNEQYDQASAEGTVEQLQEIRLAESEIAEPIDSGLTWEHDARVRKERIATRRISPWDILLDPTANKFDELRWIGRKIELPRADLLNSSYDISAVGSVSHNLGKHESYWPTEKRRRHRFGPKFRKQSHDWVVIYEIFDIVNQKLIVISPSQSEKFLRFTDNPYVTLHPYQIDSWVARGEYLLARSDLSAVRVYLDEEETLRAKLRDSYGRERFDVYLASQNLGLGNDQIDALTLPDGSMIVPVPASSEELRGGLLPLPRMAKSPDSLQFLQSVRGEIQETLHIGPNQMGGALKSETSATEAAAIRDYASQKAAFRYEAVNRLVEAISFARLSLMAQFYDERHIRALAGQGGALDWAGMKFEPSAIQHRFAVKIDPGSLRPQDDFQRAQVFQEMLQQALTIPALQQLYNIPAILAAWLDARGIKDLSRFLNIPEQVKNPDQLAQFFAQTFQQNPTNAFDQAAQQRNGVGNTVYQSQDVAGDLQASLGAENAVG